MKKIRGILALLIAVILLASWQNPQFLDPFNVQNVLRWTGLFGILSIGEAFPIITAGIDLSVGSTVGLVGTLLPFFMTSFGMPVPEAVTLCMLVSLAIGLAQGLLITRVKLQPFIVTLCGLLFLRGMARYITKDATQGFGGAPTALSYLVKGTPFSIGPIAIPMPIIILTVLAVLAGIFLNRSVYGRYILALGRNEEAARFSGVNTNAMVLLAYVISSLCAGFAGMLFALDINSVQPSGHGNFYELYAIAGAVLGGCSLRGGEGTILGVVIGTAIMRVLYNAINVLGIATQLEYAVIGTVILLGVAADEVVKALSTRRAAARERRSPAPTAPPGA